MSADRLPSVDDAVVERARAGDRSALETLLDRYADRIHAVCHRIVADPHDALDATQEAMIAIARGITRFDGRARFTTWCYRIATNAALDEVRRSRRRPVAVDVLTVVGSSSVADGTAAVEARLDVDGALARVPEEFRVAVILRDLCDLDYAEIAEILDVPLGTVRSRIARGRAALAEALGEPAAPADRRKEEP